MSDVQHQSTRSEALQAAVHLAASGNPLNAYTPTDIVTAAEAFQDFLSGPVISGNAGVDLVDLEVPF